MKRINRILIAAMVLVLVAMFANANIPPAPAGLDNDTGDYWVNYTWAKELDDPVNDNVTDSFNVSMNGAWYNGTATFLNKDVGPGGWANITVWAYNATGNGNMSVGNVSDKVQAPAMVDPPDDNPCTIMHPDSETRRKWIESYNAAPKVGISRDGVMYPDLPDNYSVLDRLDYNATERNQGSCGNCWVWAATGCMEVAHDVKNDVFDRLSIQYLNSLYYDGNLTGADHACCGGWLSDLVDFYLVNTTIAVPWNNTNASWQDWDIGCANSTNVPAASIATAPHYTITHIEETTIPTQGVGNANATENIKSVLASDNAIWFAFYLPTGSDWDVFRDFWNNGAEADLWSPDYSCGHTWDSEGGGHAVLCVGYNATAPEPYWIMLNSWGNSTNRPNGLFRMNMDINYDCYFVDGGNYYSLYWQMLDIDFADICVNETGWWRDGGVFNRNDAPIQAAVNAANQGETIHVAAGIYDENVDIETSHLTLVGEGADVVNVRASTSDHVFNVAADYVNISGFNVTGASSDVGIYLNGRQHCNISDNNASGNDYGIRLYDSSNNTLADNDASGNWAGIRLYRSSNNTLANNTANSNNNCGIRLEYSSNDNTLTGNNASNNWAGIWLYDSSNDNTLTSNTASGNDYCGIMLGAGMTMAEGVGNNTTSDNFGRRSPVSSKDTLADNDASDKGYGIGLGEGVEMVWGASNNTLTSNTASGNNYGIRLEYSSNDNTLTSNTASGNDYGIWLYYSSNNTLSSNNASNNYYGIRLYDSSNNTLANNTMSGNAYNFGVDGGSLSDYTQNIDMSNTVDGKPIYYRVDQQGGQIPTDAGYVGVVNSTNIIVRDLNLAKNLQGILFVNTSNSIIENVTASDNYYSIWLAYSSNNNTLTGNTANSNSECGITLEYSSNDNTLTSNTASGNDYSGIQLYRSSNNTLSSNTANSNSECGITLEYSSNDNTLTGNIANSNIAAPVLSARSSSSGIYLSSSSDNTLTGNSASGNSDWDIYISNSPSNTFADNTLNGTTISFTYSGDVSLKGEGSPAAGPTGWHNISKFISATNQSAGAWLYLNFSYSDSDLTDTMVESSLTVWKHNGTAWVKDGWDNGRYLDTTGNVVGVNITTFSVFAPMGVPPLHHINVTPTSKTLGINELQEFIARGYAQDGEEISEYFVFEWTISDAYIGSLTEINDTATNFTAEHVGITYITASNGSMTSGQVQVTVDAAEPTNVTVTNGAATAKSGDVNVTCDFGDDVTGWINITAIGNATNSADVNSSKPRYGLGSGDKVVSGVTINVSGNITDELAAGNGTIRIKICYNTTTLAALGIDASTLAIWKYNSTTEKWVKQPSTISGTCVYVDVSHLCPFGLFGSKAATPPTPSGGSSGGSGTYPPGWFGTPTPTVTATKAPAAPTAGATTPAPPGEHVTPSPTKVKPAAAKTAAPAAEGTTAGTAKKGAPGFTAVFAIAGMLAVAYLVMRRRE